MVSLSDPVLFPGAQVLGGERGDRIADGDEDHGDEVFHARGCGEAGKRLGAEAVDDGLHQHHADGHRRLLDDGGNGIGEEVLQIRQGKESPVPREGPHQPSEDEK